MTDLTSADTAAVRASSLEALASLLRTCPVAPSPELVKLAMAVRQD